MAVKYVNLDVIDPEDRGVVLGGKKYLVSSSIPTRKMLECLKCSEDIANLDVSKAQDSKRLRELVDAFNKALYELIKIKNDVSYDDFVDNLGKLEKGVALFNFIYADVTPEDTKKAIAEEKEKITPQKKNQV